MENTTLQALVIMNIISIMIGVIGNMIFALLVQMYRRFGNLKLAFMALVSYNKEIRFSISYLFRLKVDGRYILIKGNRIEQYQPVGGVFKTYPSFDKIKSDLGIRDDSMMTIDKNSQDDLRIMVKGKNINDFLKWFDSRKNREISVHREFIEELCKTNFMSFDDFSMFQPEFIKRVNGKIKYSQHFKCNEMLICEVYEVNITNLCKIDINECIERSNESLILATANDIECEHIVLNKKSYKIGAHAKHII